MIQGPLTPEEHDRCLGKIALLHRNTGHGPIEHLVTALQARRADPGVIELARTYGCPICQETKRQVPRPRASLEPIPPKWSVMQADNAFSTHPKTNQKVQFTMLLDEGNRFRIGKIMVKGPGAGVTGSQLIEFYRDH